MKISEKSPYYNRPGIERASAAPPASARLREKLHRSVKKSTKIFRIHWANGYRARGYNGIILLAVGSTRYHVVR